MSPHLERLLANFGWKLVCLILAVFCWFMIDAGVDSTGSSTFGLRKRTFVLPITVMTSPAEPRIFTVRPSSVEVEVYGRSHVISQLHNADLKAFVDLIDIPTARELTKRVVVHTPIDVKVRRVQPDQVLIERVDPAPVRPP